MATGFKEKMKAVLEVEPTAEMRPIDKKFIESNSVLKSHYKTFKFQQDVEVDKRKWSPAKLKDGLKALMRYDLKILAVEVSVLRSNHEKTSAKDKKASDKASNRSMMQIVKALKEVQAKLEKTQKLLDDVTPDRKGAMKAVPKNVKDVEKYRKSLKSDIKKLESEEKKALKERDGLESSDERARADELKAARSGVLPPALIKELKDCYDDLSKELPNKCSLALDEVANGGDDKKAAKAGKEAMKRLKDTKQIETLFSVPRNSVSNSFKSLESVLKNNEDGSPKVETAYKSARTTLKNTRSDFDKVGGEVENAIKYLIKTGDKKDLKESSLMGDFTKTIKDNRTTLNGFSDKIKRFDRKITDWYDEVTTKGMSSDQVAKNKREADNFSGYDKDAKDIVGLLKTLNDQFQKVEADLK
ncbi:MAG: hypothetical protein AAF526_02600 [Pseudomonadota bacterium]